MALGGLMQARLLKGGQLWEGLLSRRRDRAGAFGCLIYAVILALVEGCC